MICAVALLAAALLPVELELGGGAADPLEPGYETSYPALKPLLQARLSVGILPFLSVGGSFAVIIGGEAPNAIACCGPGNGNQAFSATAGAVSLRLHSVGSVEEWIEAGLGLGHLISLQTESASEHPPLRGHTGLTARISGAARQDQRARPSRR